MNRRRFLQSSLASGLTVATRCWWPDSCQGAGKRSSSLEEVRVGVIGLGFRGRYLIGNLPPEARVVAVCDCAESRQESVFKPRGDFVPVLDAFVRRDAKTCGQYRDYRRVLELKELDAVIIATPDHHHVLAAMLALQAGLDVYLEKPLTLVIREGRLLANLAKTSGRVVQVGSQQRTMEMNRFACEFIRTGGLGRITKVELPSYPGPLPISDLPAEQIEQGMDWNLFCGPAPERPYHRNLWVKDEFQVGDLLWRGWDLFRDYSGHMMTNWGAHSVDMVQYALGRDGTGPVSVTTEPLKDIAEVTTAWKSKTPIPQNVNERRFWPVTMKYADGVELRFTPGPEAAIFFGERGRLKMRRNAFETDPPGLAVGGPDPSVVDKWKGDGHVARPHLQNWLDCIRSRATPNAPVEIGHRTVTVCHLANIVRELNRPLRWDPGAELFVGDQEANQLLDRPRRRGFELPKVS